MSDVSVFSRTPCQLGEGPGYDPQADLVWWFDIKGRRLFEQPSSGGEARVQTLPFMASALACIDAERQLVAAEDGLYVRTRATGALERHVGLEADDRRTRTNDGRTHPSGAFWVSTMGKAGEEIAGAIYWYRGGELRKLFPGITIPNGICFSADGTVGYFIDTHAYLMMRVALDAATGLPAGEPEIFYDHRGGKGGMDGSVMDADGVIWNARYGAGALDAYSPAGERIATIALPAHQPTCPAFIGPNADRLVVTSAYDDLLEGDGEHDTQDGATFLVHNPFRGRFDPPVVL